MIPPPPQAINYISRLGQNTESRYPYLSGGGTTGKCQSSLLSFPSGSGVQTSGTARLITPNDEVALMRAVATAPTTVYFDVQQSFMQ